MKRASEMRRRRARRTMRREFRKRWTLPARQAFSRFYHGARTLRVHGRGVDVTTPLGDMAAALGLGGLFR